MTVSSEVDAEDSREDVNKIAQELTNFFSSLNEKSDKLNNGISDLQRDSADFAQKLQASTADITVGNEFDFGLTNAIDGLNRIVEKILDAYGEIDQSAVKEILEEHRKKYTMDKEREIHDVFTDGDAEVMVESEIDDNVELF